MLFCYVEALKASLSKSLRNTGHGDENQGCTFSKFQNKTKELKFASFLDFDFACVFGTFWEGFGRGAGRGFGGILGLFLATWAYIFQFLSTVLDFLTFWQEKLLQFTRCGGLEVLEGHFCIHFGGTWFEKA